jgi:tetratricopeptide (TPR) repeat protein
MSAEESKNLVDQAVANIRSEKYDEAIQLARQALDEDGRSTDAWSTLGIAYAKANRSDEATDAFQRAIQTSPYSARNYFNLASLYYGMGRKTDAIAMCQEAIRCDGKHRNSIDLLKRLEAETHTEVAPYQTSLGDTRGSAYHYKTDKKDKPSTDPLDSMDPLGPPGEPAG